MRLFIHLAALAAATVCAHPAAGPQASNTLTEEEMLALPKEQRALIDHAEQELRVEISRYFEKNTALERLKDEALATLRRQVVKPLLEHELQEIRAGLKKQIKDSAKLHAYLDEIARDVLDKLDLFPVSDADEEGRQEREDRLARRVGEQTDESEPDDGAG